jgi:amidase
MADHALPADLTDLPAGPLSQAIHRRQVSCREVMAAYLARIHRLNPAANAIVNLRPDDRLLAEAEACDVELDLGASRGWLHGLPQAIKDTAMASGLPTTLGSPLLAAAVADQDSVYVARMKAAGAIVIGKTNMPELGLGSHTVNPLFGPTPNAWDSAVSAGGSSGGAAVALAHRLLPVADGSDFMGSLRNPAGWNHVFGLRPSQGRVPAFPKPDVWISQLSIDGPMARNVDDLARLLFTQAGHDPRAPLSLHSPTDTLQPGADAADQGLAGQRIGWLGDLGGHLAMAPCILPLCESALATMADAGAHVEPTALGFSADALWQAWLVWRRALVAPSVAALLASDPGARHRIKADALWEHDSAQGLLFADFLVASQTRSAWLQHLLGLFDRFDLLALPVAQVWPFPIAQAWPRQVAGRTMDTYHRWMEVTLYATFAGLPAISVPAGFDPSGRWPMGLQLIGRPQGDAALLRAAKAYEARIATLLARRPADPH